MRTTRLLAALTTMATLWSIAPSSADAACYVAFVHGRGDDRTEHSQSQMEDKYWAPEGLDSATYWAAERKGCVVRRIGYNGARSFFDGGAANVAAQQINDFISDYDIQDGELILIGHSMGTLVTRYILNNGTPNAPLYNRGIYGGSEDGDYEIRQDSSTWSYSDFDLPAGGTISGNVTAWVDIEHSYKGDLEVDVCHNGTCVRVWNRSGGSGNDIKQNFYLGNWNGHPAGGLWQLRARDRDGHFWHADTGDIRHFSVHVNTAQNGTGCTSSSSLNHHCNFDRIAQKTSHAFLMQGPLTGVESADALYGQADTWYADASASIIKWIGMVGADRAAYYMRRGALEYASASGSWLGDSGRDTMVYTVTGEYADGDSGSGKGDDGDLNMAWGGICHHSHVVNLWLCGRTAGDGLVEAESARGGFMRSGSGYGDSGMPSSGIYRSWYSWQTIQGARTDWLRYDGNHSSGRHDGHNDQIVDNVRGVNTSSWPYYYIGNYGLNLQ
ncbi:MAG: proprotein convertase P-domain-containing protein [Deltaproteobacteria bacterium]|nr:proprotein convertase P-domain-containing protein [Deltaproteobacteria bacterium]